MSFADARNDTSVEECLDEISDLMMQLEHYSPLALAVAMRVHLAALLQALLDGQLCSRVEVHEFVRQLEREALQTEDG